MPLPKPNKGESKEDFLNRCMGNDTMNDEYPDNSQRYAVCLSQWDSKEKDNYKAFKEQRVYGNTDLSVIVQSRGGIDSTSNDSINVGLERILITGHAAVFNQLSEPLGFWYRFQEKIEPGAFANVLNNDVRALFNHDDNLILGRTTNGTLELSEDEIGLFVRIEPPDTQLGRDVLSSIRRKDITQMSFAFTVAEDGETWFEDEYHNVIRTIKKVERLYDVSPVTFPAYPQTDVSARSETDREYIGYLGYRKLGIHRKVNRDFSKNLALRKLQIDLLEME